MALPFLPIAERNFVWENALQLPPLPPADEPEWPSLALNNMVTYMANTWFNMSGNVWLFYGCGRVKNTNRSESWHSIMSKHYPHKPKYNVFLNDQQLVFSKSEQRISNLLAGARAKPQQPKYRKLVEKIEEYEQEHAQQLHNVSLYISTFPVFIFAFQSYTNIDRLITNYRHLRRISYLLHEIRNKSGSTQKRNAAAKKPINTTAVWTKDLGLVSDPFSIIMKADDDLISSDIVGNDDDFEDMSAVWMEYDDEDHKKIATEHLKDIILQENDSTVRLYYFQIELY